MTYCTKRGCPVLNCIRNFKEQYRISRFTAKTDSKWEVDCTFLKEYEDKLRLENENKEEEEQEDANNTK